MVNPDGALAQMEGGAIFGLNMSINEELMIKDGRVVEGNFSEYPILHRVKPGITGWAQVNGWRGATTTIEQIRQRVEHDLYYIENWSLTFDLIILGRTVFAVLSRANAI